MGGPESAELSNSLEHHAEDFKLYLEVIVSGSDRDRDRKPFKILSRRVTPALPFLGRSLWPWANGWLSGKNGHQ